MWELPPAAWYVDGFRAANHLLNISLTAVTFEPHSPYTQLESVETQVLIPLEP